MSAMIGFVLWLQSQTHAVIPPQPPPPTASIPGGEVPKNVRPWKPASTTTEKKSPTKTEIRQ